MKRSELTLAEKIAIADREIFMLDTLWVVLLTEVSESDPAEQLQHAERLFRICGTRAMWQRGREHWQRLHTQAT